MTAHSDVPRIHLHLIHGTWPEGWRPTRGKVRTTRPRWYQEGSEFQSGIAGLVKYPIVFHSHKWSGDNSAEARAEGARLVANSLTHSLDLASSDIHIVIGHSHGGNVMLEAVALIDPVASQPIKELMSLATPFVTFTPRQLTQAQELVYNYIPLGAGLAPVAAYIFTTQPTLPPLSQGMLAILPPALVYLLTLDMWESSLELSKKGQLLSTSTALASITTTLPVLEVLTDKRDEARRGLGLARFALVFLRSGWTTMRLLFGTRVRLMLWGVLATFHLSHRWETIPVLNSLFPAFAVLFVLFLALVGTVSTAAVLVLAVAVGKDLAPLAILFRLSVSSEPPPPFRYQLCPVPIRHRRSRWHSLHAYPEVWEVIAQRLNMIAALEHDRRR